MRESSLGSTPEGQGHQAGAQHPKPHKVQHTRRMAGPRKRYPHVTCKELLRSQEAPQPTRLGARPNWQSLQQPQNPTSASVACFQDTAITFNQLPCQLSPPADAPGPDAPVWAFQVGCFFPHALNSTGFRVTPWASTPGRAASGRASSLGAGNCSFDKVSAPLNCWL